MTKMIALAALVLASSHAFAGDFVVSTGQSLEVTTVLPTASTIASSMTSSGDADAARAKELIVAAQEDANECIRTNGAYESAALDAAFNEVDALGGQNLNVIEKAQAVIQLGHSM